LRFGFVFYYYFLFNLGEEILIQRPEKTDIAVIMYTSGSTGTPKGYFN
jgi:long-subunit acyl-CoA synthetase (AMP-forming)